MMDTEKLKTLKVCPNDSWEAATRGWTHPEEPTNAEAWGIYFIAPWKIKSSDEEKQKKIDELKKENGKAFKFYLEADVYFMFGDRTSTFSKQGLKEFRDAINETIEVWDEFDAEVEEKSNE
tara:strand:+ start:184 stop:546 length:363 start_codon:yes stop_codon:yes gene_type:complete